MSVVQRASNEILAEGQKAVTGVRGFLNSDSIFSKIIFVILVVIGFVILLRAGTNLLGWAFEPASSPLVVKGLKDARKLLIVPQDPKNPNAIPVMRSSNQRDGLEFTWTVWLYIDDLVYKNGQRKHIFHKGSGNFKEHTAFPNNGPGLYIHPTRNSLIVVMNTFTDIMEEIEITDIPMHKWLNVAIRVENKTMDVLVNGEVAMRHELSGVPKQNYGDVYVNLNGGFAGELSDLWYHDRALSGTEVLRIVKDGPNMKTSEASIVAPPYLSMQWFFERGETPTTKLFPTDA